MSARRPKSGRGLEEILASRDHGVLTSIVCQEGPGLRKNLHDTFVHADVDFGLVVDGLKAARSGLRKLHARQEISVEWVELRITLEHLVYFTSRLQLFLACAVADEYTEIVTGTRKRMRLPRIRKSPDPARSVVRTVGGWRRLRARRVRKGDRIGEYQLLADAALFVGGAHMQFTELLLRELNGVA